MMEKLLGDILAELCLLREQTKPTREVMNIPQAAEYLGQTELTLRDWVRKRKVPFYKVNGSIKFRKTKLDKWIDRNEISMIG